MILGQKAADATMRSTPLQREITAMKIYTVGGAVRDELLGLPVKDRDYVVVGATVEAHAGCWATGRWARIFPVFLHPCKPTRNMRWPVPNANRASGYKGFTVYAAPDVTLEDDLARRDLTINAMAEAEDGELIDPFLRWSGRPSAAHCYAMWARPSSRTRCASCGWRALRRASAST